MAHTRQTIREAVATILRTTPTNWTVVSESRIQTTRQVWPYLMVFAESSADEGLTDTAPKAYNRELTLTVVGLLKLPGSGDTQTVEDKMDVMSAEIETKLTTATLRAVVSGVKILSLVTTSMDVIIEEDGIDHAELNMTWRVTYQTLEGLPEAFI